MALVYRLQFDKHIIQRLTAGRQPPDLRVIFDSEREVDEFLLDPKRFLTSIGAYIDGMDFSRMQTKPQFPTPFYGIIHEPGCQLAWDIP